jgi:succinate dehydrogenase / fumarate reductase membrane anchor subunit
MSLRSPLGKALGTGSAKDGASHWYAQRVSAVALVLLGLWFVLSLASLDGGRHDTVVNWLRTPLNSALAVLFVAVAAYHAVLGLQVIAEDYVGNRNRRVALMTGLKFLFVFAAVVGILAVLRIAFGVAA